MYIMVVQYDSFFGIGVQVTEFLSQKMYVRIEEANLTYIITDPLYNSIKYDLEVP